MKILIALDIHKQADPLLSAALSWLEGRTDIDKIDLVHAFDLAPATGAGWGESIVWHDVLPQWERAHAKARADLEALLAKIPEKQRGMAMLPLGGPDRMVPRMSSRYDLVIVGTHQHQGLKRMWLGSHAERLVRRSDAPVLVVPLKNRELQDGSP